MSQSPTTSAATPDVTQDAEPTVVKNGMAYAPVLIIPQKVMFSTATAMSSRPASIPRRLIDTIRFVGAALHRPPALHHPQRNSYLEHATHGPRNGPIMIALQTVVTVVLLALFAVRVHDLQLWLERWDHARHFND